MPAQTRRSSRTPTFKAYDTKQTTKQVFFPHRRKVVRDKPGHLEQDSREPRQMMFLKERMRIVEDSEDEVEKDEEELSSVEPVKEVDAGLEVKTEQVDFAADAVNSRKRKKRNSDFMRHAETEEPPALKRRRQPAKKRGRQTPAVTIKPDPEQEESSHDHASSESETERDRRSRRRRQSTMTQLIDGRRPQDGDEEPKFRPVRRISRRSWSNSRSKDEKDRKQRTLTQMVPGLTVFAATDDDETENELENDEEYTAALVRDLAASGVFEPATEKKIENTTRSHQNPSMNADVENSPLPTHSRDETAGDVADTDDSEDEYHPTQHIPVPATRRRRTLRRTSVKDSHISPSSKGSLTPKKNTRFRLLATPERRRIVEIPSSQSPPASPLSTQRTPRRPLKEASGNQQKPQQTPSRRKKVMFSDNAETFEPHPAAGKRKFGSQVLDSEDEDDALEDDDNESLLGQHIGAETQMIVSGIDRLAQGRDIGNETQAILHQIDQACANVEEDRMNSEELGDKPLPLAVEESQELGVACNREETIAVPGSSPPLLLPDDQEHHVDGEPSTTPPLPVAGTSQQRTGADIGPAPTEDTPRKSASAPINEEKLATTGDKTPPSHTLVQNQLEAGADTSATLLPPPQPGSNLISATPSGTLDLDGEPIEVPRSPIPLYRSETQDTAFSHSSKAEQQIQQEWRKSQHIHRDHASLSSTLQPNADTTSYQATPLLPSGAPDSNAMPPPNPQWPPTGLPLSQATTVDPTPRSMHTTPTKKSSRTSHTARAIATPTKAQVVSSTHTTPQRIPNSQPSLASPEKPASLVIPSSFPSPSKGGWRHGEWSSPVLEGMRMGVGEGGELDLGSLEDFSIPPMPPTLMFEEEADSDGDEDVGL